jgi:hypothetical protein
MWHTPKRLSNINVLLHSLRLSGVETNCSFFSESAVVTYMCINFGKQVFANMGGAKARAGWAVARA